MQSLGTHEGRLPERDPASWSDRRLPNGLRSIVVVDPRSTTVAISIGYHVGGKDDPAGQSGFAHLFEHLMFKGTAGMPSETLDRLTEDVGGFNNAYTSADLTVYYEVVPAQYLELLLWAEAQRLSGLIVDQANFDTERDVVIGEYDQRVVAEPYGLLDEIFEKQLFPDHHYAQGVIGDPESLRAADLDAVKAFHATYYRPDNAVLVVVGDLDLAITERWIDTHFASIARPAHDVPRVPRPPHIRLSEPSRIRKRVPNVKLPVLNLAYRIPSITYPDAPVLDIIECILGVGKSSRLHRKLVYDLELAVQAFADTDLREHSGVFQVRALLHDEHALPEVEKILRSELQRLCDELVTEDELSRARNQLQNMYVRRNETANDLSLVVVSDALLRDDPWATDKDADRYQFITAEEVRNVARACIVGEPAIIEYLEAI